VVGRRWPATPNASGTHFLPARLAAEIVRHARVGAGDLVLDLGAGRGALTAPLAATGARVVAVEINPGYAESLRRSFAGTPNVSVVAGDLRRIPLPQRDFRVVANIPFDTTTELLRRLLDPIESRLVRADLVVQYDAVRRPDPWWSARYDFRRVRWIPAAAFRPPPSVDAAVLVIERHPVPVAAERALRRWFAAVARTPDRSVRAVLRGEVGPAALRAAGIDPRQPAGLVGPRQWRALAVMR
jgi:23S rRNA (adenine-N6)-dimethyltransferase